MAKHDQFYKETIKATIMVAFIKLYVLFFNKHLGVIPAMDTDTDMGIYRIQDIIFMPLGFHECIVGGSNTAVFAIFSAAPLYLIPNLVIISNGDPYVGESCEK